MQRCIWQGLKTIRNYSVFVLVVLSLVAIALAVPGVFVATALNVCMHVCVFLPLASLHRTFASWFIHFDLLFATKYLFVRFFFGSFFLLSSFVRLSFILSFSLFVRSISHFLLFSSFLWFNNSHTQCSNSTFLF